MNFSLAILNSTSATYIKETQRKSRAMRTDFDSKIHRKRCARTG
jgi:hypothetical protein